MADEEQETEFGGEGERRSRMSQRRSRMSQRSQGSRMSQRSQRSQGSRRSDATEEQEEPEEPEESGESEESEKVSEVKQPCKGCDKEEKACRVRMYVIIGLTILMILLLALDISLLWLIFGCGDETPTTTPVPITSCVVVTDEIPNNTFIAKLGNVKQRHRFEVGGGMVLYADGSEILKVAITNITTTNGTLKIDLNEAIEYQCTPGYVYIAGDIARTCSEGNKLNGSALQCVKGKSGGKCESSVDCLFVDTGKICKTCCIGGETCSITNKAACSLRCRKGCANGFKRHGTEKCYKAIGGRTVSHSEAKAGCRRLNAELAMPKNEQQQKAAVRAIEDDIFRTGNWWRAWMGLEYYEEEKKYKFTDGTVVGRSDGTHYLGNYQGAYTNWNVFPREPNLPSSEFCVAFYGQLPSGMPSGTWYDDVCSDRMNYVCQSLT